jgi:hypothetical protein
MRKGKECGTLVLKIPDEKKQQTAKESSLALKIGRGDIR